MGYEVDIIGVGQESKSGDAIAIRWGNLYGQRSEQKVVVIDGGFKDCGYDVVKHIKIYYGTDRVDAVISTHPDQDHINGLHVVLDKLTIGQLWMHKPWQHNQGLSSKFSDGRVTDHSLGERLRESLDVACDLVRKAETKGIHIVEPFAGISLYNQQEFCVLGPTLEYYESLIQDFDGMPTTRRSLTSILGEEMRAIKETIKKIAVWGRDDLSDQSITSAKNNSSVISQLIVENCQILFTGDAGIPALSHAVASRAFCSSRDRLVLLQIPHHGSRRNVGPTVLNQLVGQPVSQGKSRGITAIASTSKKGEPKHPRKAVMNALTHRGVSALATRGITINHSRNAPSREDWYPMTAEPYSWEYDDEE